MSKHGAHHVQFARYIFVGATANALVLGLYWSLSLGAGLLPELSLTLASASGFILTYAANRMWSFRYRGEHAMSLLRYLVTYIVSYCLQLIVLFVGTDTLGYPHQYVVVLGVLIAVPVSYALLTLFVFPHQVDVRLPSLERAP